MKTLFLYFMFFVGSSLIFIQCAQMFPTVEKRPHTNSSGNAIASYLDFNKQNNFFLSTAMAINIEPATKNNTLWPFLNNYVFPYNVITYLNSGNSFYKPYVNFTYYNFINKYSGKPNPYKQ